MDKLLKQIEDYKNGNLTTPELQEALTLHISRLNIEFLEERFGKVENIGSMLGFYEVCDVIYESLEKDFKLAEEEDIKIKVPVTILDLFKSPKIININDNIEKALGKLKDVHDRKKLDTIKYELIFRTSKDIFNFVEDIKLIRDRVASLEKHEKKLIIFTYEDLQNEIVDICKNRYDVDLKEI